MNNQDNLDSFRPMDFAFSALGRNDFHCSCTYEVTQFSLKHRILIVKAGQQQS